MTKMHPADIDDEQHPDDNPIAGPAASRTQSFQEGLQVRARMESWRAGEVESLMRERTRSRGE